MANLPLNMATRIVDLGCAKGDLVLGFTDCGCDACGIDISEQMVQAAQTKGINVVRGRFEDIEEIYNAKVTQMDQDFNKI